MSNEPAPDAVAPDAPPLRAALRRARAEAAGRADVVIELRQAEFARLEILREALAPVFAELPATIDLFDLGLVGGERPRLFVDMVAFVEMGRDRRSYVFQRDGRSGRTTLAESERVEPIVEAVTAYVARRMVERARLLAEEPEPSPASSMPVLEPPVRTVPVYPRCVRLLACLFAFGLGGGFGVAAVAAVMIMASKGLIPWVN